MKRIERPVLFMKVALLFAERGACERLQTGCVITQENRIVATGYNGPLAGTQECGEFLCDTNEHCRRAVHAEANAIYFAAKTGIPLRGSTLYTTHSPCVKCAEAIIQAGITKVYYYEEFRDTLGLEVLMLIGISCILLKIPK